MTPRDHTATIALCTSLVLHGAISCFMLNRAARDLGKQTRWAALPVPQGVVRSPVFIEESTPPPEPRPADPSPKPAPEPKAKPVILPLLPAPPEQGLQPVLIPRPEPVPDSGMSKPIPMDGFGELTGDVNATAMHSLSGDRPMQAPKFDQDQPLIRREPSMRSGEANGVKGTEDPPVHSEMKEEKPVVAVAAEPKPAPAAQLPKPAPDPEAVKIAMPEPQPEPQSERLPQSTAASVLVPGPASDIAIAGKSPSELLSKPVEIVSAQTVSQKQVISDAAVAAVRAPKVAAEPAARKTSQPPAGDVAPQSDSDSDAFTTTGSAEFRPGKVVARFGTAVRTVLPKLSLAGRNDLLSLAEPRIVLEVRANETGDVQEVRVTHSSGSDEIDQQWKLAMYQWWFEPPRDSAGRPHRSVMTWTIHFAVR